MPVSLVALGIDPASPVPRYRQLYESIREAILTGRLRPGARRPSTRALAAETGSARRARPRRRRLHRARELRDAVAALARALEHHRPRTRG